MGPFWTDILFWLPATLGVFWLASAFYKRSGQSPLANPTFLSIAAIAALLLLTGVPYETYSDSVSILNYLLGTAVVALAIPLHRNLRRLRGDWRILSAALLLGSATSILAGTLIADQLGAATAITLSIAPKSATAAVSMEIGQLIGGLAPVTACLTIMTGVTGAVLGPLVLTGLGIAQAEARGLALGTVSHGIATARAFSESELTGCWALVAMCLNAILTAILAPLVAALLF
jgi:predicted murein hydrolase (TIGR00659 family)